MKLTTNRQWYHISKMKKFCTIYNEPSTKNEKDLTNHIPKASNFYGLPKIYKSEEVKIVGETQKSEYIEIPNTSGFKSKPIVASP